jgi:Major Facilitator Superfamily
VSKNVKLLYGFSFFDQFMIVIALWIPYLTTHGISMRQFMELQAVFAIVILSGEVPSGLLSDLWGRKKTLLLGATLKALSFSLLPLWSSYEGFLFYHLTMGIALSMISGGDVALLWDSYLADGGEKSRGAAVLGNATFAAQIGTTASALLGGVVVMLSYGHLLWANALLSWIPVLLVLGLTEPPASAERPRKWAQSLKDVLSATVVRDTTTRLVFLNMVIWGSGALVMFWVNQKYWQETAVPLPWFGVLLAAYNLVDGFAAKCAAFGASRYGRRPLLAVIGVLPVLAYFGMASFFGWGGILFGFMFKIGRGVLGVLFMEALNERISSAFRATVISLSQLGLRASFCLVGPLVGHGIDAWGIPVVLSALGVLFSIVFVGLLLPLALRDVAPAMKAASP